MMTTTTPRKRVIPSCLLKLSLHARSAQTNVKVNDNQSLEKKMFLASKKRLSNNLCGAEKRGEKKRRRWRRLQMNSAPLSADKKWNQDIKKEWGRGRKCDISLKAGELDAGVAQTKIHRSSEPPKIFNCRFQRNTDLGNLRCLLFY